MEILQLHLNTDMQNDQRLAFSWQIFSSIFYGIKPFSFFNECVVGYNKAGLFADFVIAIAAGIVYFYHIQCNQVGDLPLLCATDTDQKR